MKKVYVSPMAKKIDYTYEEQVAANSITFVGNIGSLHQGLNLCQMGVNEQGISTCTHYFYDTTTVCKTDQMPMSLRW